MQLLAPVSGEVQELFFFCCCCCLGFFFFWGCSETFCNISNLYPFVRLKVDHLAVMRLLLRYIKSNQVNWKACIILSNNYTQILALFFIFRKVAITLEDTAYHNSNAKIQMIQNPSIDNHYITTMTTVFSKHL